MKYTQQTQIIDYLKTGKTLSPLECLDMFGCMKLATRIGELKKQGFNIGSEWRQDFNTNKKWKEYYLNEHK
jgi:hypothetical protein